MTEPLARSQEAERCPQCGSDVAPGLLACPGCQRLVHAETLRALAKEAEQSTAEGRHSEGLARWRQALDLLPPESRQHAAIQDKVRELSGLAEATVPPMPAAPPHGSVWARWLAPLGAAGLVIWKLKFILVFALTKAKLLLLGLTKLPTLLSMLFAFGVYWTAWGWKFALGLIASIYVHEMGHVFALTRYGIRASAPMFIPGLGAFVRMEQYPAGPREDARVGLAGPLWGLLAAVVTCCVPRHRMGGLGGHSPRGSMAQPLQPPASGAPRRGARVSLAVAGPAVGCDRRPGRRLGPGPRRSLAAPLHRRGSTVDLRSRRRETGLGRPRRVRRSRGGSRVPSDDPRAHGSLNGSLKGHPSRRLTARIVRTDRTDTRTLRTAAGAPSIPADGPLGPAARCRH